MKKILLVVALIGFGISAQAQEQATEPTNTPRKFYLGFSTGFNQGTGLIGITGEYLVAKNLTVNGVIGLGTWGFKTTGGLKYYLDYPGKWAFGVGYSYSSGVDDVPVNLQEDFVQGQSGNQTVNFNLLPASTVNISAIKYFLLGKQKKNRFHLEFGYAIPTSTNRYETDAMLTSDGTRFMKILQPGGLLLGAGFSFGL